MRGSCVAARQKSAAIITVSRDGPESWRRRREERRLDQRLELADLLQLRLDLGVLRR
jgi:hypothetical protein